MGTHDVKKMHRRYKMSVFSGFLTRAYKVTTNWKYFHQECQQFKQLFINNNYLNVM